VKSTGACLEEREHKIGPRDFDSKKQRADAKVRKQGCTKTEKLTGGEKRVQREQ